MPVNYQSPRRAAPTTRAGKIAALTRFVEDRIAAVGNVTEDAIREAGFQLAEVAELLPDVRARLAARGIGGFAG